MKISLYERFCTDTLRHRQTAHEIIEEIDKINNSEQVIIDFSNIKFASRSFCHELVNGLKNKKNVRLDQQCSEVQLMIQALDKPKLRLDLPLEA